MRKVAGELPLTRGTTRTTEELGLAKYQTEKEQTLELDLRENRFVKSKEAAFRDLNRSTFFHRLVLGIGLAPQ